MGLGSFNSGGNATYLTVGMGKDEKGRDRAVIGRPAKKGDPGAVQVFKSDGTPLTSKKSGEEIWRTEYGFVEGTVSKIERASSDYGDRLNIHISAGVDTFILQLERGDYYWVDFAHRADNIDFARPVKFRPFSIPREDNPKKSNKMLVAYQGGKVEKVKFDELGKGGSHAPFYDEDEKEWRFGKRDRFLDEGPIQRAIEKVEFLNNQPTNEIDREDEIYTLATSDPQEHYGAIPPQAPMPNEADAPKHIVGEGDDLPW